MPNKYRYRVVVLIPWTHQIEVFALSRDAAKREGVRQLRRSFPGWASRASFLEMLERTNAYKI